MSGSTDTMALEDVLAPPLANGELVFAAPWQGRIFGMARSLCEAGYYSWDDFRLKLIEQVRGWDRAEDVEGDYHYYDLFLAALETLLVEKSLIESGELSHRVHEYLVRPHDHDH